MDREKLASCLLEIGPRWDLVLQDWELTCTIDLKDKNAIDQYLGSYDKNKIEPKQKGKKFAFISTYRKFIAKHNSTQ